MTLFGILTSLGLFALGFFAGRWTAPVTQIADREPAGQPGSGGDVEPTEFAHVWPVRVIRSTEGR